ncbi:MAG: ABC transporter permease [Cytophagales bacterium]|nr:ABC transporter permease [Cytophagales bacterium]
MNESIQPSKWAVRCLRWFCREEFLEDLEGDLMERFDRNAAQSSRFKSNFSLWKDVMALLRPSLIKPFRKKTSNHMFNSHVTMALRSARKEKVFSILNVLGLAMGFSACLYIGMYVLDEARYDTFHEHAPNIYRINQTFIWGDTDNLFGSTGPGVMPAIQAEVPEFDVMTRVHPIDDQLVHTQVAGSKMLEETKLYAVDSTFFKVFTFPLLQGNPNTAMVNPNSIILTESIAKKYFGDQSAYGQQILLGEIGNQVSYQVTGIAKDVPRNSHIQFNALTSMSTIQRLKHGGDTWWWTTFVTFGRLRPDADPELVAQKVAQVPGKYLGSFLPKYQGITYEEFLASGEEWDMYIQPMLDIRLFSHHVFSRLNQTTDIKTIYILGTIAVLILLLSIINFVNLTTARAAKRGKEVGIRKTLGSNKKLLVQQFLVEAMCFSALAIVLSFVLIGLLLPFMDFITGKPLPGDLLFDPIILGAGIASILMVGVVAGLYPAFVLSAFRPLEVMKGQLKHGKSGILTRNALVILQFTISIGLISGAMIIRQHVQHWMEMDLGFDRSNKLVIEDVNRLKQSMGSFEEKIRAMSEVEAVSFSSDTPPYLWDIDEGLKLAESEKEIQFSFMDIDEHFIDMYGMELVAGRNFTGSTADKNHILVDESVLASFDIQSPEEAIGRTLLYDNLKTQIIGVFKPLITEVNWEQSPIVLYYKGGGNIHLPRRMLSVTFKREPSGEEMTKMLQKIEKEWSAFSPNRPLRYTFSDQEYEQIFAPTIRLGKVINLYAALAILIAGLGLTGLLAYMIERRNKELGVRKVLGAPIAHLLTILTVDFTRLMGIGFVLASAASWWVMNRWSEEFMYRAPISFWTFIWAGLLMLGISLFIMSFQSVKAALSNPIRYLREE